MSANFAAGFVTLWHSFILMLQTDQVSTLILSMYICHEATTLNLRSVYSSSHL